MKKMTDSFYQKAEDKKWHVVDLNEEIVGRVAQRIATILRGKHSTRYTPHSDNGDFVVAVNSDKLRFTGNKLEDKMYYSYTGYVGNLKEINAARQFEKDSREILIKAVKGMLPKGPLGRSMLKKLKVYTGNEHPHEAQVK